MLKATCEKVNVHSGPGNRPPFLPASLLFSYFGGPPFDRRLSFLGHRAGSVGRCLSAASLRWSPDARSCRRVTPACRGAGQIVRPPLPDVCMSLPRVRAPSGLLFLIADFP